MRYSDDVSLVRLGGRDARPTRLIRPIRPTGSGASGFTLIEVLAALLLVALVLPAAMRGVSLAVTATAQTHRREVAATLAVNKLNDLIATGGWSSEAPDGDFGEAYPEYHWELTVEDWEGASVQLIQIDVLWESRGQPQSLTMSTLLDADNAL